MLSLGVFGIPHLWLVSYESILPGLAIARDLARAQDEGVKFRLRLPRERDGSLQ